LQDWHLFAKGRSRRGLFYGNDQFSGIGPKYKTDFPLFGPKMMKNHTVHTLKKPVYRVFWKASKSLKSVKAFTVLDLD